MMAYSVLPATYAPAVLARALPSPAPTMVASATAAKNAPNRLKAAYPSSVFPMGPVPLASANKTPSAMKKLVDTLVQLLPPQPAAVTASVKSASIATTALLIAPRSPLEGQIAVTQCAKMAKTATIVPLIAME